MNRNNERHFNQIPEMKASRTRFNRDQTILTTFDSGKLIPFYVDEVLPGDTFNVRTNAIVRLSNPAVRPVMDDMYLDYYYFFVPSRLLWKHFEEVHGENKTSHWTQPTEFVIPTEFDFGNIVQVGSFYQYLGIPTGSRSVGLSLLPYAAYLS